MMQATHDCPIEGCRIKGLSQDILMCPPHWRRVPKWLQQDVYREWRIAKRYGISKEYLDVRQKAIDAASMR